MIRFSIRDVLWLTVVVALALGWLVNWSALNDKSVTLRHERDSVKRDLANARERITAKQDYIDELSHVIVHLQRDNYALAQKLKKLDN